jgi:hypothetical protein
MVNSVPSGRFGGRRSDAAGNPGKAAQWGKKVTSHAGIRVKF